MHYSRKKKTNLLCVNSGYDGECQALMTPDWRCGKFECPFYKTEKDFYNQEFNAKRRCKRLGIVFTSRDQVIDKMNRSAYVQKKRYEKEKRNG